MLTIYNIPNSTKKSASTQLGRWIRQKERLKKQLNELGYKEGKKILTPNQVKTLAQYFGEP